MEKNNIFPVVVEELKNTLRIVADKDVKQMNANVASIAKRGVEFAMNSVEELTKKSAEGWIKGELSMSLNQLKERFNGIIGSDSTIAEYQKKYHAIEKLTAPNTEAIRLLLNKYAGMWRKDTKGFCLDEKLLDEKVSKESEWQPTTDQEQYFALLQSVRKSLDDLMQFEKKNGWSPFMIFGFSGAEFFGCRYEHGRWYLPDTFKLSAVGFHKYVNGGRMCKPLDGSV